MPNIMPNRNLLSASSIREIFHQKGVQISKELSAKLRDILISELEEYINNISTTVISKGRINITEKDIEEVMKDDS